MVFKDEIVHAKIGKEGRHFRVTNFVVDISSDYDLVAESEPFFHFFLESCQKATWGCFRDWDNNAPYSPSMGVLGFTAGDIRRMYLEGVPDWVKGEPEWETIGVKGVVAGSRFRA